MRKTLPLLTAIAFTLTSLTACGGGGSTNTAENFVAGDGATTYVSPAERIPAPELGGMTLLGTTYQLPKNEVAVVNVWASWCSPCRAEEPTLAALTEIYPDVNFLGILTRDNPVNAEAFIRKRNSPYPTLIDDSALIGFSKSLPANAIPSTVVIDKNGLVAGRISGIVTIASLSELLDKVLSE
jgi:thiol-disulfide isomerase/thioredoxin